MRSENLSGPNPSKRTARPARSAQIAARRAWIFAMLNILALLIVDSGVLVVLHGLDSSAETTLLFFTMSTASARVVAVAMLGLSLAFKAQFSMKTFGLASQARAVAVPAGEKAYLGNARGAKITTVICGLGSAVVLGVAAQLAF